MEPRRIDCFSKGVHLARKSWCLEFSTRVGEARSHQDSSLWAERAKTTQACAGQSCTVTSIAPSSPPTSPPPDSKCLSRHCFHQCDSEHAHGRTTNVSAKFAEGQFGSRHLSLSAFVVDFCNSEMRWYRSFNELHIQSASFGPWNWLPQGYQQISGALSRCAYSHAHPFLCIKVILCHPGVPASFHKRGTSEMVHAVDPLHSLCYKTNATVPCSP